MNMGNNKKKEKNVRISLPSTKQEREKEQNNLRVF